MDVIRNFPCMSIIFSMAAAIVSSALSGKAARKLNSIMVICINFMSVAVLYMTVHTNQYYVYKMGRFPAPFGNEIRFGTLEAIMAFTFGIIMLLCILGGRKYTESGILDFKENMYYVLLNLLMSSLLALVYTNDLFTAYVFIEINTIAACGLIMAKENGHTLEAATRYLIMNSVGSGLILLGLCVLYDLTGHLLMSNVKEQVAILAQQGTYHIPLTICIVLICVGLAIKSALFPFHAWVADAYGYSNVTSASILSSLVSKGYIFLLIKIFYRVIGFNVIVQSNIINVLFIFGLCGMILGSLHAIREKDIRRMIAYSSVAQIGYIYMGFGLGTEAGMTASVFHILSHAATKSMLFLAAAGLVDVSGDSKDFEHLTGAGYRNKIAGVTFSVGALSMVGVPLFSGFISKILFAQACVSHSYKMLPTLICLAISTILNAIYFMKTVVRIYTPEKKSAFTTIKTKDQIPLGLVCICFIICNVFLGMCSEPIVKLIANGIELFA